MLTEKVTALAKYFKGRIGKYEFSAALGQRNDYIVMVIEEDMGGGLVKTTSVQSDLTGAVQVLSIERWGDPEPDWKIILSCGPK